MNTSTVAASHPGLISGMPVICPDHDNKPACAHPFMALLAVYYLAVVHIWLPNLGGSALDLPNNCFAWCLIAALITIGIHTITRRGEVVYSSFSIVLVLCVCAMLVPFCYGRSKEFVDVAERFAGLGAGLLLFLTIQQYRLGDKQWMLVLAFIAIAAQIECAVAWTQHFWLHAAPVGTLQQRNNLATLAVSGLFCSAVLLFEAQKHWQHRTLMVVRAACLASPLLAGYVILTLRSQVGWLTFVLCLAILLWKGRARAVLGNMRWVSAWGIVLVASMGFGVFEQYIGTHASMVRDALSPETERIQFYRMGIDILAQTPWAGTGYGNFATAFLEFRSRHPEFFSVQPRGILTHPHNELLLWGIEGGLLPLLALLATSIGLAIRGWRRSGVSVFWDWMLLLPLAVHALVEYPFHQAVLQWTTFILLIAYAERAAPVRSVPYRWGAAPAVIAPFVVLIVWVYMLGTIQATYYLARQGKDGRSDLRELTHVLLPAGATERFYHTLMFTRLFNGLAGGDVAEVEIFLRWAETEIPKRPVPSSYKAWITALLFAGERERASEVLREARRLFPTYPAIEEISLPALSTSSGPGSRR